MARIDYSALINKFKQSGPFEVIDAHVVGEGNKRSFSMVGYFHPDAATNRIGGDDQIRIEKFMTRFHTELGSYFDAVRDNMTMAYSGYAYWVSVNCSVISFPSGDNAQRKDKCGCRYFSL
jgi:hypothetical protein